jgi:rhodanese-related sulfurtransferase
MNKLLKETEEGRSFMDIKQFPDKEPDQEAKKHTDNQDIVAEKNDRIAKMVKRLIVVIIILALFNGGLVALYLSEVGDDDGGEHTDNGNGGTETREPIIQELTVFQAYTMIQNNTNYTNNTDFHIIDVRPPDDYNEGHILGAINLDYFNETFEEYLFMLDKNDTYLLYCDSGLLSGVVLDEMEDLRFMEVYNILKGFDRWKELGYDVET